jgi:hypothetical protein
MIEHVDTGSHCIHSVAKAKISGGNLIIHQKGSTTESVYNVYKKWRVNLKKKIGEGGTDETK